MGSSELCVPFTFSEPYEFAGDSIVEVNDGNRTWSFVSEKQPQIRKIYNMELHNDDVWLLGYPKSGNTWVSEIIYTIAHGGTKEAKERSHFDRWCFPELNAYEAAGQKKMAAERLKMYEKRDYFQESVERESPRFVRTHLPFGLLPPQLLDTCKVVYICRNLKDVVISGFNMTESSEIINLGNVEAFMDFVMSGKGMFQPACEFVKEAWEKRHHPNMLFLYYEDLKKDLSGEMHKIASFLGTSLTEEQVKELENHLTVESMRKNNNINMWEFKQMGTLGENADFIRKGISGDWKNYFTSAMLEKWDKWMREQMADTDFKYKE